MIQIDMDMPRSCFDCDLSFLYPNEGEIIGEYRCCLTNDNVDGLYSCRADNCPLKEVSQEPVLDKIRAEILEKAFEVVNPYNTYKYINVLDLRSIEKIIDKYKAESEAADGERDNM